MRIKTIHLLAFVVLSVSAAQVHSQNYDLSWFTIDGGGGASVGGTFALTGTAGQPDAGAITTPMSGGTFQLVGGFSPVAGATCSCQGDLNHDGVKNGRDINLMVGCVIAPGGICACANLDGAGGITLADVSLFISDLLAGAGCP